MTNIENTFIRGPSPSYSDEASSENGMATLPLGAVQSTQSNLLSSSDNFLDEKLGALYDGQVKKGRRTFVFWAFVTVLTILAMGNLLLTVTIVGVLRLGRGIQGMEMIPEEDVTKFYGRTDLDRIYSKNFGQIEGFSDVPVSITGDDGNVLLRLIRNGQAHPRMVMDKTGIQFRGINSFEVKDKEGGTIFTTHRPEYNMKGADALEAKTISASRVVSPIDVPLKLEGEGRIAIRGSEGVFLDASSVLLQAEHNIALNSSQGNTVFKGSGIFLDMDKIPIVSSEFGLRTGSVQYKLCVCMPHGKLFRIPVPRVPNGPKISCAHFNPAQDPCAAN